MVPRSRAYDISNNLAFSTGIFAMSLLDNPGVICLISLIFAFDTSALLAVHWDGSKDIDDFLFSSALADSSAVLSVQNHLYLRSSQKSYRMKSEIIK